MPAPTAAAHEGSDTLSVDGYCYWWGQAQWVGYTGSVGTATGVVSYWEGPCTAVSLKMRYYTPTSSCVLRIWDGRSSGEFPALRRTPSARHFDYSDADVLRNTGIWSGFRVDHSGGCAP